MAVPERVVISGAGCCTALGHDLDSVARSLREGRDAFRASGALEGLSVCPAEDWGQDGARQQFEGWRHRHYLNRGSRMAVLSGLRALRDAGLEAGLPVRSQIIAAVGPMLDVTGEPGLPPQDTATLGALWLLRWLPNTAAGALARFARGLRFGPAGPGRRLAAHTLRSGRRRTGHGRGQPPFAGRSAGLSQGPGPQSLCARYGPASLRHGPGRLRAR